MTITYIEIEVEIEVAAQSMDRTTNTISQLQANDASPRLYLFTL